MPRVVTWVATGHGYSGLYPYPYPLVPIPMTHAGMVYPCFCLFHPTNPPRVLRYYAGCSGLMIFFLPCTIFMTHSFSLPCMIFATLSHEHDTEDLMWPKRLMTDRLSPLAILGLPVWYHSLTCMAQLSWSHLSVRFDDLALSFLFCLSCTIRLLKSHRHDTEDLMWPKRHMTGRPGPLVWPEIPVWYFSRARPSPLWAYNTFSMILFVSLSWSLSYSCFSFAFSFLPWYSVSACHDGSFSSISFYLLLGDSATFDSRCI